MSEGPAAVEVRLEPDGRDPQAHTVWTDGTLDRQDRVTRFTRVSLNVELEIDDPASTERAERLLHKAEEVCLVTQSLNAEVSFQARVKAL